MSHTDFLPPEIDGRQGFPQTAGKTEKTRNGGQVFRIPDHRILNYNPIINN